MKTCELCVRMNCGGIEHSPIRRLGSGCGKRFWHHIFNWREEKCTYCHPSLTQHSHTLPLILFSSSWRSRKMEKTQAGRDADSEGHTSACKGTHTHAYRNFPWSQSSISLPTDPHSSLIVSLELSRACGGYCPSEPNETVSLPLKKPTNMLACKKFLLLFFF